MENILIVGCGLTGSVLANKLSEKYNILIIDKRDHIGGNCYDYYDNGILMNKYGAHIFHTNNETVWNYVNKFDEWIPWYHKVIGKIDNKLSYCIGNYYKEFASCSNNKCLYSSKSCYKCDNLIGCYNENSNETCYINSKYSNDFCLNVYFFLLI